MFSTTRSKIQDIISGQNHIRIVFYHHHTRPFVHKGVQNHNKFAHFMHVQPRCRLIENIKCPWERKFAEFTGDLDALGLSS